MSNNPLVTIITPCYNGEKFLNKYFKSILLQTYPNIELILINDGSTDATDDIVFSYKSALEERKIVFKYIVQENGGQAKAINAGLKEMHGQYLIWPDSDDLLAADSIEKRVNFLEKHPEYAFVRSNGDFFDFETEKKLYRISNHENRFKEDIFLDLILEETYCCCGCYMIRSCLLKEVYPDLRIYESPAGQNWQILIPIAGKYKCGFIDEDLYHVAVRKNSHSRHKRTLEGQVERYLELKKILEIGIKLSGRRDRDYQHIVDVKYFKILFRLYMNADEVTQGNVCYAKLKEANEIEQKDYKLYLKKNFPVKFQIYSFFELTKRIVKKVKRIIFSNY